jgi:hypothetical protein
MIVQILDGGDHGQRMGLDGVRAHAERVDVLRGDDRGACRPNVAVGPGRFSGARVGNLRRMLAFGNIGLEGQNACSVTRS